MNRLERIFDSGRTLVIPDPRLRDFRNFLTLAWEALNLPSPTRAQYAIARFIQEELGGVSRDCVIECVRGLGKSYVAGAVPPWLWLFDNSLQFLVTSATGQKGLDQARYIKRLLFSIEACQHLVPETTDRNTAEAFDVAGAPISQTHNLRSVAILGNFVGGRADIIIADDVEAPSNSETPTMRAKLEDRTLEFGHLMKPEGPQFRIYLGTPHAEETLYESLRKARGAKVFIWPALYPDNNLKDFYGDSLAPEIRGAPENLQGKSTDPERWTDTEWTVRRQTMPPQEWAMQYMLDPRPSSADKYPLSIRDLIVADVDSTFAKARYVWGSREDLALQELQAFNVGWSRDRYHKAAIEDGEFMAHQGVYMAVDPSGSGKDETGYAVVAQRNGYLFLLAAGGFIDGHSDATLEALANAAATSGAQRIVVESNFGDGMYARLLSPKVRATGRQIAVEDLRSKGQKEKRICDVLQPVITAHKLIVTPQVIRDDYSKIPQGVESPGVYRLFYQLSRITRERQALVRDDRLDALAIAVSLWTDSMAQDPKRSAEEALEERIARRGLRQAAPRSFISEHLAPSESRGTFIR